MKNKTESRIIIEMKNIDHAEKIAKALEEITKIWSQGGDATLASFKIGHDVNIRKIYHEITSCLEDNSQHSFSQVMKRLYQEKNELDGRLKKLLAFQETAKFKQLLAAHIKLLNRQRLIMELYSEVLAERIDMGISFNEK